MNIKNYILEKDFKMILSNNYIDIINYLDIISIDDKNITIKSDKNISIKGNNLSVSKLLDNEILIIGDIEKIELI